MQSTTTKRQRQRQLHGLGLNEQQPTLAANSLAPIRPAYATERFRLLLMFRPETSIDRRTENTDSDVQHVPVIGGPEPVLLRVPHRTLERRRLHSVSVPFDFDEVFDADYLFFYEPLFADVTEA